MKKQKVLNHLKNIISKDVTIAIVINLLFLIMAVLLGGIKYEVSDDYIMDAVLSGAFGNSINPYLLFSNSILGFLLKPMYVWFPKVSWYFMLQISVCFVSLCVISYVILKRNDRLYGVLLCILFASFVSDDLYLLMQFTKTATVAMCAGGVLFLYGIWTEKREINCVIIGSILAIIGSMIRFKCIYFSLLFLLFIFINYVVCILKKEKNSKKIVQNIILSFGLVLLAFFFRYMDMGIRDSNEAYSSYVESNALRASVLDSANYGYDSISEELLSMDLDQTDYWMIRSWNILDKDIYTEEVLERIATLKKQYHIENKTEFDDIFEKFIDRGYQHYTIVFGIFIICIMILFLYPKRLISALVGLIPTISLLFYFFYAGRVVYRVEYSVFLCYVIYLIMLFEKREINEQEKASIVSMIILLCVCKIPLYIPDSKVNQMNQDEYRQYVYDTMNDSWSFCVDKYKLSVVDRPPEKELISYIQSNKDKYYMLDFVTTIQRLYLNYKPWQRIPSSVWDNCYYLGSITYGFPDNRIYWQTRGIEADNPNISMVNENVYVIDNYYYDTKLNYLKKYYYPEARKELVGEIDGFYIWKYYNK